MVLRKKIELKSGHYVLAVKQGSLRLAVFLIFSSSVSNRFMRIGKNVSSQKRIANFGLKSKAITHFSLKTLTALLFGDRFLDVAGVICMRYCICALPEHVSASMIIWEKAAKQNIHVKLNASWYLLSYCRKGKCKCFESRRFGGGTKSLCVWHDQRLCYTKTFSKIYISRNVITYNIVLM